MFEFSIMRKILSKILLLLALPISVLSQENDFRIWTSFAATNKIDKKRNLTIKQGFRFRENASLMSKRFTDAKIRYKHNKNWYLSFGYRFSFDWNKKQKLKKVNRFYADFTYRKKLNRFNFSIRNRLLKQGFKDDYEDIFRQKFSTNYNIRKTKLEPSLAFEYFYSLEKIIKKLRFIVGITYPILKDLDFELAYRIQQEFNTNNPETLFILDGKMSYNF